MQNNNSIALITSLTAIIALGTSPQARPEVLDAEANGFTIRIVTRVDADRMAVYLAAVDNVGKWWHDDHTISGFAENMYIDARVPGGCFCEDLGQGAGIMHMMVTYVSPGIIIRLSGGLGPLGLMGVDGNMTWEFDDREGGGTVVTLNYAVGGYYAKGLDSIAPAVDGVLAEAMDRLRAYAESGDPGGG